MIRGIKFLCNLAGGVIAFIGLAYVAIKLRSYSNEIDVSLVTPSIWLTAGVLIILYAFANFLLALGWGELLGLQKIRVSYRWLIKVYFISQIAKYIPGNVFHIAGRQALGSSAGLNNKRLAKTVLCELVLLIIAGAVFLPLMLLQYLNLDMSVSVVLASFSSFLAIFLMLSHDLIGKRATKALIFYGAFLLFSAVAFTTLFEIVSQETLSIEYRLYFISAYTSAWLVGFVTPGSPAGLGVRELILFALLSQFDTSANLAMAIVLGRIVNTVGDLGSFVTGILMSDSSEAFFGLDQT